MGNIIYVIIQPMKKLYMITLGGKAKGAKIEVHDVQFIIAKDIEETFNALKENWYGIDFKLHLDAYKEIKGTDGYSIEVTDGAQDTDLNLYFVNIGAYDESMLNEIHFYKLIVGKDINEAKKRAIVGFPDNLLEVHVDNISIVAKSDLINKLYSGNITLKPSQVKFDLKPDWFGYKRIDI